jgi:hypothetical protein
MVVASTRLRALQTNVQWHTQTPAGERVTPASSSEHQQQQEDAWSQLQQSLQVRQAAVA